MSAYTITRNANSIAINSYTDTQPGKYKVEADALNNKCLVSTEGYKWEIDCDDDTITVNGEAFAGNVAALKTLLYSNVFCDKADGGGGSSYLVYVALLSQSGVANPIANVLQNTIVGAVTPQRSSLGNYFIESIGNFPYDKIFLGNGINLDGFTYIPVSNGSAITGYYTIYTTGDGDSINISFVDSSFNPIEWSSLLPNNSPLCIEIRVYP